MSSVFEARLADEKKLESLAKEHGDSYVQPIEPACFIPKHLSKIGITYNSPTVGNGYIKLTQRDFIVEEIRPEGRIVTVSPVEEHVETQANSTSPKVAADMIKHGADTFEAVEVVAEALRIDSKSVGYSGLKDGKAITAQEISLNNVTLEQAKNFKSPYILLKNIRPRDGVLSPGSLKGNRFTIVVRTEGVNSYLMHDRIAEIKQEGVLNFFSLQRFGSRLIAHDIGRAILQGRHEEAVRLYLAEVRPYESPLYKETREEVTKNWGNWVAMKDTFSVLPHFMRSERRAIFHLMSKPNDFSGALASIPDLTKIFVQAYGSYCFNRLLSLNAVENTIPETLPILSPESVLLYEKIIGAEELHSLRFRQDFLPFINMRPQDLPTRLRPEIHTVQRTEVGYIFNFDLGKGSYATTFLSQIFDLYQGQPVPEWVNTSFVDSPLEIGHPSIKNIESLLS